MLQRVGGSAQQQAKVALALPGRLTRYVHKDAAEEITQPVPANYT